MAHIMRNNMLVEDYPAIRQENYDHLVRVSLSTASAPTDADDGYINLRVEDGVSGTVLADLNIDPARFWRLLQGGVQTWPGFIGPDLERVGKMMENQRIVLPEPLTDDTERDLRRDVSDAVREQLAEDWWDTWEAYDRPRRTNRGTVETAVRRWVTIPKEG